MNGTVKNKVIALSFVFIVVTIFFLNIICPPRELSFSERRKLQQFPAVTLSSLLNGSWIDKFEKYSLDQFVFREEFRALKAAVLFKLFRQKDNNGIYLIDEHVFKMEYPLKEKSIARAAQKLNEIYDYYLQGMNVYYAIIPDKNYFAAAQNGYPGLDYQRLVEIMNEKISKMKYIDLFSCLKLSDYYRTDLHWRQERLQPVVAQITHAMGLSPSLAARQYTQVKKYPFYGAYYGQAALPLKPEELIYLTNESIEAAVVYYYDKNEYGKVYATEKFGQIDSYDLFLSGAVALLSIENPHAKSQKELIIFRDSYGSSLAPLLLAEYQKITLIDLRYIAAHKLGEFIDFKDQDVLFLYSTLILNNSEMLK
ncbi:MAG: hypothetical protein GX893_07685 [Firmicutes bacterium]|nr:hypothetical protein [Bacillota bacterium]